MKDWASAAKRAVSVLGARVESGAMWIARVAGSSALALVLAACASDAPPESGGPVSDSAGVRMIANEVDLANVPQLTLTEDLRIGSVNGPPETQFDAVRLASDSQGRIYVSLTRAGEIRQFDADGKYLRTIGGGSGQGPGEFQGLGAVYVLGDTLVAVDGRLRRLTTFTTEGAMVGTTPMPDTDVGAVSPGGAFRNGWFFNAPLPWDFPEDGKSNEQLVRLVAVSGTRDVIEAVKQFEVSGGTGLTELSYGRTFGFLVGTVLTGQKPLWEQRFSWGTDDAGHAYVVARDEYRIDVFDATGQVVSRIRRSHQPVPISQELVDRLTKHVRAHYDTLPARGEFGENPFDTYLYRATLPHAPNLPALGALRVARDGSFMVERLDEVADPVAIEWTDLGPQDAHWDLFAADGTFRGSMTFPPSTTPYVLAADSVLCVVRDELGVEYVVRYRIG